MSTMRSKPNIVYILADDLGYGDVACLNPRGKIPTPNMDRLAEEGMIFSDAHSSSALCSPSRYSILTGRYNWRSAMQRGVVSGYGKPLIARDRLTVGALLRQNGYRTSCIGKWHLGWNWALEPSEHFLLNHKSDPAELPPLDEARVLWEKVFAEPVADGPTTRGFDYYFGVDIPNVPPYAFIENDHTVGIPSEYLSRELVAHNLHVSQHGPAVSNWTLEAILPTLGDKACDYIDSQSTREEPFFLYMPLTSPHCPLAVNDEWKGKSGLGLYADFVMETDAVIGRVLDALDNAGIADSTLAVLASDNGCAGFVIPELEEKGHFPSAHYRGWKGHTWDGGHRIPFIARWPEVIEPGSISQQTTCLSDLMATCADILGVTLPDDAGEDSVSILPLLRGEEAAVREHAVHHSGNGKFAVRKENWKLLLCAASGMLGGNVPTNDEVALEMGMPSIQLYHMEEDPGERHNLHAERPDKVRELAELLAKLVNDGRSTPGIPQRNDVTVDIWKGSKIER